MGEVHREQADAPRTEIGGEVIRHAELLNFRFRVAVADFE